MKRRWMSLLLSVTLALSAFTGCGNGMNGKVSPKDIIDAAEPMIGYVITKMDKAEIPKSVVIFQEGTALMFQDTEYTMGDFSKMTDEEVIENLHAEKIGTEMR